MLGPCPWSSDWSEGRFQFLTRAEVVPGICPAHTEMAAVGGASREGPSPLLGCVPPPQGGPWGRGQEGGGNKSLQLEET